MKTIILASLVANVIALSVSAEPQGENKLSKEIQVIDSKIQRLNNKNKERKTKINRIERELQSLDKQLTTKTTELTRLNRKLKTKEKRTDDLRSAHKGLLEKLQTQKQRLAEHLRSAQMNAKKVQARSLTNADPLPQYLRNQQYFSYFQRAQNALIRDFQSNAASVAQLSNQLSSELDKLDSLKQKVAKKRAALSSTQRAQKSVVASLTTNHSKDKKQLLKLATNRDALNQLLEQLQNQPAADSGFTQLQGKLEWPVKGKITKQRLPGVTIVTPTGEAVHAIAKGRIVFADRMRGFGLLAIIDHGGGYMSLYGHNQSLSAKKGKRVSFGEKIATTGTNRDTDQAGLYFEIRQDAAPLDPRDWCKDS